MNSIILFELFYVTIDTDVGIDCRQYDVAPVTTTERAF